jgi:hypothetical protein
MQDSGANRAAGMRTYGYVIAKSASDQAIQSCTRFSDLLRLEPVAIKADYIRNDGHS